MSALSQILKDVRRVKTEAGVSMKAKLSELEIMANKEMIVLLKACDGDISAATHVNGKIVYTEMDLPHGEIQTRIKLV